MGDININLLQQSSLKCIDDFINVIYNNSFQPVIDKPTRISKSSITLIDNIFTNVCSSLFQPGIFYSDITDHLPIFLMTTNLKYEMNNDHAANLNNNYYRKINDCTINTFKEDLSITDWSEILSISSTDNAYDSFLNKFKRLYDKHFVFKKKRNKYIPRKPWITRSLLKCI